MARTPISIQLFVATGSTAPLLSPLIHDARIVPFLKVHTLQNGKFSNFFGQNQ